MRIGGCGLLFQFRSLVDYALSPAIPGRFSPGQAQRKRFQPVDLSSGERSRGRPKGCARAAQIAPRVTMSHQRKEGTRRSLLCSLTHTRRARSAREVYGCKFTVAQPLPGTVKDTVLPAADNVCCAA